MYTHLWDSRVSFLLTSPLKINIQIMFCARENVSSFNAAGPKNLEIRYVLSELDGFAVVLINRNRAFDFSAE